MAPTLDWSGAEGRTHTAPVGSSDAKAPRLLESSLNDMPGATSSMPSACRVSPDHETCLFEFPGTGIRIHTSAGTKRPTYVARELKIIHVRCRVLWLWPPGAILEYAPDRYRELERRTHGCVAPTACPKLRCDVTVSAQEGCVCHRC